MDKSFAAAPKVVGTPGISKMHETAGPRISNNNTQVRKKKT